MRVLLILMSLTVMAGGCGKAASQPKYNHPQRNEIKAALIEMLGQSKDPFVIVEIPKTEKFVQFYNEDGEILIDLPKISLTPAEAKAASTYFSKCGINLETVKSKDPKNLKAFSSDSWAKTYPREQLDTAIDVSIGALTEICGCSEAVQLKITKGWK